MSRCLSSIHGVPFRKIVKREKDRGWVTETLSCGHTNLVRDDWKHYGATKRRCYRCKGGEK
jgi:hypothetical protein